MSLQYLKEHVMDEVDFLFADNIKGFFKLILSFQLCLVRYAQITQYNKLAISLQYHKKEVSAEDGFLDTGKHESFPQTDTTIFDEDDQAFPKFR